jgi:hypothetical protein
MQELGAPKKTKVLLSLGSPKQATGENEAVL